MTIFKPPGGAFIAQILLIFCNYLRLFSTAYNQTNETQISGGFSQILQEAVPFYDGLCPSELELRYSLLTNSDYTPSVRPVLDATKPVEVSISLSLTRLNDILEKEQLISVTGFISLEWKNEYMVWQNNSQFGCINALVFPEADVWLPDVSLTNTGDIYDLVVAPGHKVRIHSNGSTLFHPAKKIDAFCDLDLTYFPFDKQKCSLNFESWLYTIDYQTLKINAPPVRLVRWTENDQWLLVNTSGEMMRITYEDPSQWFDRAVFTLVLHRRVAYYTINVIGPSIIIAFVELVIFMLPTVEIEKVPISFTCLLAYSVFQLMINDDMPRTSEHTPMLSYYIVLQMVYLSVAIMGQGCVFVCIWSLEQAKPVPKRIYKALKLIGRITFVKEELEEAEREPAVEEIFEAQQRRRTVVASREPTNQQHNNLRRTSSNNPPDVLRNYVRRLTQIVEQEDDIMSRHRRLSNANTISPIVETIFGQNEGEIKLSVVAEEEPGRPSTSEVQQQQNGNNVSQQQQISGDEDHAALTREMLERIVAARHHSVVKSQWLFMANVIDRCILFIYCAGIALTPVIVFGVLPTLPSSD